MTGLNSSVVFWNEPEIIPNSILLISSGAGGDRLLFWHPITSTSTVSSSNAYLDQLIKTNSIPDKTTTVSLCDRTPISEGCHSPTSQTITSHNASFNTRSKLLNSIQSTESCSAISTSTFGGSGSPLTHNVLPTCGSATILGSPTQLPTSFSDTSTTDGYNSTMGIIRGPVPNYASASAEMTVEEMPVSSLLSLLHPSTQEIQHKIYVKLSSKIFVGVALSLSRTKSELAGYSLDSEPESPTSSSSAALLIDFFDIGTSNNTQIDTITTGNTKDIASVPTVTELAATRLSQQKSSQAMTSFAVVFSFSDTAQPSVLSHFTELARLIGVQLRRAELFWSYLITEREKIVTFLDCQLGITSGSKITKEGVEFSDELNNVDLGVLKNVIDAPRALASQVFALIAKRSQLCVELTDIAEAVTTVGRVNVLIKGLYPVFFCLPFKAYALLPVGHSLLMPSKCWPAIRPRAIWRAMEKIRPYHTLLLTTSKKELLDMWLPPDVNLSLPNFIRDLSPTVNIGTMSLGLHSQEHCLRLALWLVYHGHAIIIFPIAGNNTYSLAPLSHLWLHPKIVLEFATQFPSINLAEVLASFSNFQTLKNHLEPESESDSFLEDTLWRHLNFNQCVGLLSWLLRRRLVIQLHTYVVSLIPARRNVVNLSSSNSQLEAGNTTLQDRTFDASIDNECDGAIRISSENETLERFHEIHAGCTRDLVMKALPNESDRQTILSHYCSVDDPRLLFLFLRILNQLPAHLEEIMFVESVERQTIIQCIEEFSVFLTTLRLPDPITSCFAGVEWQV